MPASEKFYQKLRDRLTIETDREVQNKLLDLWIKTSQEATNWDAVLWGFDPDTWMAEELYVLRQRYDTEQLNEHSTIRRSLPE